MTGPEKPSGGAGFRIGGELAFELQGHEDVTRKLGEVAGRLGDATGLYDLIGQALVTSTIERFERETGPDDNPWPVSLRVMLEGGKTLTDTGVLRGSITHIAAADSVEIGTNDRRAATHQFGATIVPVVAKALRFMIGGKEVFAKKVTIPARPFLGLDESDEVEIMDIVSSYVLAPIGGGANAG